MKEDELSAEKVELMLANSPGLSKGGGMYLVFPVTVIVTAIVLLQCLSCSFGQN